MSRTSINNKARKKIAEISEANEFHFCMIKLQGCGSEANHPAHRHKRAWYYDKPEELLWNIRQWIPACIHCHQRIEFDKALTEKVFKQWDIFIDNFLEKFAY